MASCCNYRWVIFTVTFISYISTHTCRQSFASAKTMMETDWGFTKHFEGLMDAFFLSSYALGLFSSGVMGDKFDTGTFHAFGLFVTSFIYLLFGISVPFFKARRQHIPNILYPSMDPEWFHPIYRLADRGQTHWELVYLFRSL
eukprot:552191_1